MIKPYVSESYVELLERSEMRNRTVTLERVTGVGITSYIITVTAYKQGRKFFVFSRPTTTEVLYCEVETNPHRGRANYGRAAREYGFAA